MPPAKKTTSTLNADQTAAADKEGREFCDVVKRLIFSFVNFIVIIISCIYVSHAYTHNQIINNHAAQLKEPYGGFDLSMEKVGWIFAIGRAVFGFVCLLPILAVPEWMVFAFAILNLVFEVPMAAVAESTFGYQVTFSVLDMNPPTVVCSNTTLPTPLWNFYSDYAVVVGKLPSDVCHEFGHEGSLLRGGILFCWFTLWIPLVIVAFVGALCKTPHRWYDILTYLTGIPFDQVTRAGARRFFSVKVSLPAFLCCGRRPKAGSEVSTLFEEERVTLGGTEKV